MTNQHEECIMAPKRSLTSSSHSPDPLPRPLRWSDTQQRRDFSHILKLWDEWKKNHEHDFLEIEAAADGIDEAFEAMDELMKGRIIRDD
jgi:hypothetical protein